ncbi:odorant receptor 94a-like isoform X1 [Bradysia coprophila]|uniref:odorant receptor 94a-like isoform X1 n=1 Tax=Bradysia coprophila TaxID=38358 RepID=UPI00187DB579|nr:odorant receptor 94a-like isoform X1 [Bradysia coprophila]
MAYVLWKNRFLLMLVHETGTHSTNDQKIFIEMRDNLNFLMKFGQIFMMMVAFASFLLAIVFPIANYRRKVLFVNVAFPLDKTHGTVFWIASLYLGIGIFCATVMTFFAVMLWYIMFNFVIDYKLLGRQLKDMGKTGLTLSTRRQDELYREEIISAISTYDRINGNLKEFASTFSSLFFLQIATSSLCICGMVYSSAFSTHDDLVKDGVYFIILSYSFFDIFMIMYMGNEIKLSSEGLSYCLFESNWNKQTKSNQKCVLIFEERLRKQQQIIISKIYILNLATFRSIVNTAYSMFSLLVNLRTE